MGTMRLKPSDQLTEFQKVVLLNQIHANIWCNPQLAIAYTAIMMADRNATPFTELEHERVAQFNRDFVRVPITPQKGYTQVKEGKQSTWHTDVITRVARHLGYPLVRSDEDSTTRYRSRDGKVGVIVMVSKVYTHTKKPSNWYSPTKKHLDFMKEYDEAYVAFGCGKGGHVILLPKAVAHKQFLKTTKTVKEGNDENPYHHQVKITWRDTGPWLHASKDEDGLNVKERIIT